MESVFLKVLDMSVTASYVIAVILLLRLALRRWPKKYSYALWSVAAFRLVCPVSFSSALSLFNLRLRVGEREVVALGEVPGGAAFDPVLHQAQTGIPSLNEAAAQSLPAPTPMASANPMQIWIFLAAILWCVGMAALLLYAVASYARLRRRLRTAVPLREEVWQSDAIPSPFILGFFRPRIYVPFGLDGETLDYVLAHERFHLRRLDHIVRPLAFLILTLHWFNPLVWLAFFLMARDMEMRCDEQVLSGQENIRKPYSAALLSFAAPHRFPSPGPLAFGESGVKGRIQNILRWKKPAVWVTCLATAVCVVAVAACAANPPAEDDNADGGDSDSLSGTIDGLHTGADGGADASGDGESAPLAVVTSGGAVAVPYAHLLYATTWTGEGWTEADGVELTPELIASLADEIPTVTLGRDFDVSLTGAGGLRSSLSLYDEDFQPLPDEGYYGFTALNWLPAGTYYAAFSVYGALGAYVPEEDRWEESGYLCLFRLRVEETLARPLTPADAHDFVSAELWSGGQRRAAESPEALSYLEGALSGGEAIPGGAGCPFGATLYLTRADGAVFSLCPAEDSCAVYFSGGAYYDFGSGNEEFWAIFPASSAGAPAIDGALDTAVSQAILDYHADALPTGLIGAEAHLVLSEEATGAEHTVYAVTLHQAFAFDEGALRAAGASYGAARLRFSATPEGYVLTDYAAVPAGEDFVRLLREHFPQALWGEATEQVNRSEEYLSRLCAFRAAERLAAIAEAQRAQQGAAEYAETLTLTTARGETLQVVLEGEPARPELSYRDGCYALTDIRVYHDGALIQRIDPHEGVDGETYLYEGLFVNPENAALGGPEIRDFNFDGAEDFRLLSVDGYPKNVPSRYFLWDEEAGQFAQSFVMTTPLYYDEARRELVEAEHSNGLYVYRYYAIEDGLPVLVYQEETDYLNQEGAPSGQVWVNLYEFSGGELRQTGRELRDENWVTAQPWWRG